MADLRYNGAPMGKTAHRRLVLNKTQRAAIREVVKVLLQRHGREAQRDITEGVTACVRVWDFQRGGAKAFRQFCERHYVAPGEEKTRLLRRLDSLYCTIRGAVSVVRKESRAGLDIADAPLTPAEELLGAFTVGSHLHEDFRTFEIAPLVQLNFGTERRDIPATREGWVARRLAEWGREFIPARLLAEQSAVQAEVDKFVSGYNLYLDRIDFGDPDVVFPQGTRVSSHWGLRDYMMSLYDDPHGLKKQRAILGLMQRVVRGEVPAEILDNADAQWDLVAGTVTTNQTTKRARGHGGLRWAQFRKLFGVQRRIDAHTYYGNLIDQKFFEDRELEETRVRQILTDVMSADVALGVGAYLAQLFRRPLEPFDLYFKRFTDGGARAPLGYTVGERYPDGETLQRAIPGILQRLGFSDTDATFVGSKVRVDNGRSAGHAWSPAAPFDIQLLRVRIAKTGINEIEFGTFMHELGHCVEGVLSSYRMDYRSLWGVPNTALTECFAFTFQDRADEVLGRKREVHQAAVMLQRFWEAYEIAGPALVEIDFFHWLYDHPRATAAQMHDEIRKIADRVWNKYYRRVFNCDGHGILAVYSHILWCDFYLADYPLGYVAAYQIRRFLRDKVLGKEMPRMCAMGQVYPDVWMENAVGAPLSAQPLLEDTAAAVRELGA